MTISKAVLFIGFNRPECSLKVLKKILSSHATRIYIALDAPRSDNEFDLIHCKKLKDLIDQLETQSKIPFIKKYQGINQGCKLAVSGAISWFFENEEEGIILEDDCLPNDDFFRFCWNMLDIYRLEEHIMHIGGNNFFDDINWEDEYFFSKMPHIWGWATWRRAWKLYDIEMKKLEDLDFMKKLFSSKKEHDFFINNWRKVKKENLNTWDYQWNYTVLVNQSLAIVPKYNLVENIGFNQDATHTTTDHLGLQRKGKELILGDLKLKKIIPNRRYDQLTQEFLSGGSILSKAVRKIRKIKNQIFCFKCS